MNVQTLINSVYVPPDVGCGQLAAHRCLSTLRLRLNWLVYVGAHLSDVMARPVTYRDQLTIRRRERQLNYDMVLLMLML